MKNKYFRIELDPQSGAVAGIYSPVDPHCMNWCAEDTLWGRIHCVNRDQVSSSESERQRKM